MPDSCGHPAPIDAATSGRTDAGSRIPAAPSTGGWAGRISATRVGHRHWPGIRHRRVRLRAGSADAVAIGQLLPPRPAVLYLDCAESDELGKRPVDGVDGLLVQPGGQGGAGRHPGAGGVAVAQQHRVQPQCAVADVGVEHPLRDDGEPVLQHQLGRPVRAVGLWKAA